MDFFVGLPTSVQSIHDAGMERFLDDMERARVDAVILNAQEPSGSYYRYHEEEFAFTRLKPFYPSYATEGDKDMLGIVAEKAKERGMQVYSHTMSYDAPSAGGWPRNDTGTLIAHELRNFTDCSEIDLFGRRTNKPCLRDPDYRQFYISAVRDQLLHYDIAGINYNIERIGPIPTVMVGNYASLKPYRKPEAAVCFCPNCVKEARERGIDVGRAKQGYRELLEFSERSWRHGRRVGDSYAGEGVQLGSGSEDDAPSDGYFIEFMRILGRYPEILAWNTMWYDGLMDLYAQIASAAHSAKAGVKVGLHIWHHRSLCPFERASYDYEHIRRICDWVKPKLDPTCGGFRLEQNVKRWHRAIGYDMDVDVFYAAYCQMLGFKNEAKLEDLKYEGISFESLKNETAATVKALRGQIPVYPGIGIDMPAPHRPTTPQIVKDGLYAIADGGAKGVILSRGYGEMRQMNLIAAGEAIDEIRRR